jgi:hypothetical protein
MADKVDPMNLIAEIKNKIVERFVDFEKRDAATMARIKSRFKPVKYPSYISQKAKWRVNILRKTKYLSQAQKDIILPKTKNLMIKLAYINLVESRFYYFWNLIQNIVMLVFTLNVGFYASRSIVANPWNSWGSNPFYHIPLNGLLVGTISLLVYMSLRKLVYRKSRNRPNLNLPSVDFLLSFVGLTILVGFSGRIVLSIYTFALYTLLFGIGGRWLLSYLFNIMDTLLNSLLDKFVFRKLAESIVVNNTLKILNAIELHPESLSDLEFKKIAITWLDYVAQSVGEDIPKLIKTMDGEFNNSIKLNYQNIANSIKDKKLLILMPREDTAQCLANYLANFLFHFIKGDWDLLERSDTQELTLYEKWTKRYLPLLRPLIFIGIPLIAFWGLKLSNLTNEPWAGTVFSYIILWIIINIIWLIDPTAKEKMGSFKDATGLF